MRKHPILLILIALAVAVGWWGLISLMVMSHNGKKAIQHPVASTCQIQIDATKQSLQDRQVQIAEDLDRLNDPGNTEDQVENWKTALYGEWQASIYPACKSWNDQQWDAYRVKWDARREATKGKEWMIDQHDGMQDIKRDYNGYQEPLYLGLSRDRQYLAKWEALLKTAPADVVIAQAPPP